jgi:hypothetical protein
MRLKLLNRFTATFPCSSRHPVRQLLAWLRRSWRSRKPPSSLRFPGRILQQGEQPPAALCAFVAEQLGLDAADFGDYAERDQTRREHVLEIETALGLRPLTRVLYRELAAWLLPTALATDHGPTLVTTLLEELRARRIVCPSLPAIERLAGSVRARAQRQLLRRLADGLTDQQRQALDQLLHVRVGADKARWRGYGRLLMQLRRANFQS